MEYFIGQRVRVVNKYETSGGEEIFLIVGKQNSFYLVKQNDVSKIFPNIKHGSIVCEREAIKYAMNPNYRSSKAFMIYLEEIKGLAPKIKCIECKKHV